MKIQVYNKPIAFASRTLATAKQKHSQLDTEALANLFNICVEEIFVIYTDHKPLICLFCPSSAVPKCQLQDYSNTGSDVKHLITAIQWYTGLTKIMQMLMY